VGLSKRQYFPIILEMFQFIKKGKNKKFAEISEEVCKRVINDLSYRLNYSIMKNGKHFSNIMNESRMSLNIVNPSNLLLKLSIHKFVPF
jgi:hypothetical protein